MANICPQLKNRSTCHVIGDVNTGFLSEITKAIYFVSGLCQFVKCMDRSKHSFFAEFLAKVHPAAKVLFL